jgi:hypothetical protein
MRVYPEKAVRTEWCILKIITLILAFFPEGRMS